MCGVWFVWLASPNIRYRSCGSKIADSEDVESQKTSKIIAKTPISKEKSKTMKLSEDETGRLIDFLDAGPCLWDAFSKEQ